MADSFYGEIRAFAFNYAPVDWSYCDGSLLPTNQYQGLYALIGNVFGGDQTKGTFAVPDLRGLQIMGVDASTQVGNTVVGATTVTLTTAQTPPHTHTLQEGLLAVGAATANVAAPTATTMFNRPVTTANAGAAAYTPLVEANKVAMNANIITPACGNTGGVTTAHDNRQPNLALNFCICTNGYWPINN